MLSLRKKHLLGSSGLLRNIERGNLDLVVAVSSRDELGRLALFGPDEKVEQANEAEGKLFGLKPGADAASLPVKISGSKFSFSIPRSAAEAERKCA